MAFSIASWSCESSCWRAIAISSVIAASAPLRSDLSRFCLTSSTICATWRPSGPCKSWVVLGTTWILLSPAGVAGMLACAGGAGAWGRAVVGVGAGAVGVFGAAVDADDAGAPGAETGRAGACGAGAVGAFGGGAVDAEGAGADKVGEGTAGVATTSTCAGTC